MRKILLMSLGLVPVMTSCFGPIIIPPAVILAVNSSHIDSDSHKAGNFMTEAYFDSVELDNDSVIYKGRFKIDKANKVAHWESDQNRFTFLSMPAGVSKGHWSKFEINDVEYEKNKNMVTQGSVPVDSLIDGINTFVATISLSGNDEAVKNNYWFELSDIGFKYSDV